MTRKMIDCRTMPSEVNCTLAISGEEEEVVRAAAAHASDVHGHTDGPELRTEIRHALRDAPETASSPS
jgi:predicted small metal-binding protein